MAARLIDMSQKTIIGPDCNERFLPLDSPGAAPLRARGVLAGALSLFRPPLVVARPNPDFHFLAFTTAGRGRFRTAAGAGTFAPLQGRVFPARRRRVHEVAGRKWELVWFRLEDAPRWSHLREFEDGHVLARFPEKLRTLVEGLLVESHSAEPRALAMAEAYAELIGCIIERQAGRTVGAAQARAAADLARLWHHVEGDLSRAWSVDALCELVSVSRVHLHRLVRAHHGCAPMKMVERLRMRAARVMLSATEYTLEVIAERVGYGGAFAFSKAFKRSEGVSPAHYRRR